MWLLASERTSKPAAATERTNSGAPTTRGSVAICPPSPGSVNSRLANRTSQSAKIDRTSGERRLGVSGIAIPARAATDQQIAHGGKTNKFLRRI